MIFSETLKMIFRKFVKDFKRGKHLYCFRLPFALYDELFKKKKKCIFGCYK